MVVQSATIAGCRGNSETTALPSSGGSQHTGNQSNSNAVSSPTNVAANNILSLAKRTGNRTA